MEIIHLRDDVLDQESNCEGVLERVRLWIHFESISIRFADGLDLSCDRKRGDQDDFKFLA